MALEIRPRLSTSAIMRNMTKPRYASTEEIRWTGCKVVVVFNVVGSIGKE